MFLLYMYVKLKYKKLYILPILLILLSCNASVFPDNVKKLDSFSTMSIFFPPGRNPEILPPDDETSGPECSCAIKDANGSRMTGSAKVKLQNMTNIKSESDDNKFIIKKNTNYENQTSTYKRGEVIIKFRTALRARQANIIYHSIGPVKLLNNINYNGNSSLLQRVALVSDISVEKAVVELQNDPNIEFAQPNYIYKIDSNVPNDYEFIKQWGLNNTGQSVNDISGTAGYDINAARAWDIQTDCSAVIIAVLDTGVNYNHSDLKTNMWDGSLCVDDSGNPLGGCIHGYDFVDKDKEPLDMIGHGTHVAGIIGAQGNDGNRISGVCWKANIMAVRVLDPGGEGTTADIVSGIHFAIKNGAKIINASWGSSVYDQALYDAIKDARDSGVLFIAAAGNDSMNNDTAPHYPANFDLDNIFSVAALNQNGNLASFSSYGVTSVHIAAPGTNILSTYPAQKIDSYEYFSSWTRESGWNYQEINGNIGSYAGLAGELYNPPIKSDIYSNNMDSCAYRVFNDLTMYGPDMITLNFFGYVNLGNGDNVYIVYDSHGNRPLNNIGALEHSKSSYGFNLTSIATNNMSLGFRFVTDGTDNGYGVDIIPYYITRWYHSTNATACLFASGTSMATPHVSGVAGLVWASNPGLNYVQVKNKILNGSKFNNSLDGKISGGRMLDAYGAINAAP